CSAPTDPVECAAGTESVPGDPRSPGEEAIMRRRAIRVEVVSVLFLAGARTASGAPPGRRAPGETAGGRPAGALAVSSLAPRGWDLYLFEVASRRTRRLTDHPALDFNAAFATARHTVNSSSCWPRSCITASAGARQLPTKPWSERISRACPTTDRPTSTME